MKLICIGRNYTDHIKELANEKPEAPVIFLKPDSAILLKQHPFVIPEWTHEVHYEVEVVVKIKKLGKYIDTKFADTYYDQIGLGIDFTARDVQAEMKKQGLPWEKAKAFDGAAVIGNWIKKDIFNNLNDLNFTLKKNDSIVQAANTSQMLWKIDELISYVSQYFTLKIGDVLFTGTPAGVGPVAINDTLTGYLENKEMFSINIK